MTRGLEAHELEFELVRNFRRMIYIGGSSNERCNRVLSRTNIDPTEGRD